MEPEEIAYDDAGLALLASLFVDKGDAALVTKGRKGIALT